VDGVGRDEPTHVECRSAIYHAHRTFLLMLISRTGFLVGSSTQFTTQNIALSFTKRKRMAGSWPHRATGLQPNPGSGRCRLAHERTIHPTSIAKLGCLSYNTQRAQA
jgi:hypothetical protein